MGSQLSVLAEAMGLTVIYYDVATVMPLGNAQPRTTMEEVLKGKDTFGAPPTVITEALIGNTCMDGWMDRGRLCFSPRPINEFDAQYDSKRTL